MDVDIFDEAGSLLYTGYLPAQPVVGDPMKLWSNDLYKSFKVASVNGYTIVVREPHLHTRAEHCKAEL